MKKFLKYSNSGVILHVYGSDCWTINKKPVLFMIKRIRKPPISDGWVAISIILFYIINITIGVKGYIK